MSPRLAFAIDAVHRAGRFTLGHFQVGTPVDLKADETPVTAADRGAERLIRELIEAAFPGEAILGEEEGGASAPQDRWVIDPIDGTKSFVSGVPLYATLLSYERDGQPVVAACSFPALGEIVYAELGRGAYWNGRPCRVSSRPGISGSVLCTGSHASMAKFGHARALEAAAAQAMATRTWSDAYGHALVATGRVEAMIDPIVSRWDISPMVLIVRESGGRCSRFDGGDPFDPSLEDGQLALISSNGLVHDELLAVFQP